MNKQHNNFHCPDCDDEHKACHCGENCECGEQCECYENCKCHEGEECTCGDNCHCKDENCKCGENCDCEDCDCEDCNCEDCNCGEDCDCEDCNCGECDCEDCQEEDDENCDCEHCHHDEKEHKHEHKHNESEEAVSNETLYYLELAQRLKADFDNYKRRNEETARNSYQQGIAFAVEKLLVVADSLTQAKATITDQKTIDGLNLVLNQMLKSFESLGVKKIDCVGKAFDPNFHNAVFTAEDKTKPDHEVLEEFQMGFLLNDKVIRHSVVKINKLK